MKWSSTKPPQNTTSTTNEWHSELRIKQYSERLSRFLMHYVALCNLITISVHDQYICGIKTTLPYRMIFPFLFFLSIRGQTIDRLIMKVVRWKRVNGAIAFFTSTHWSHCQVNWRRQQWFLLKSLWESHWCPVQLIEIW